MTNIACPHCNQSDKVIKFGTNRSGTFRYQCGSCKKTFTPQPKNRALTEEKEAQIHALLRERISQRGIARALHVGRQTIRAIRKKGGKTSKPA